MAAIVGYSKALKIFTFLFSGKIGPWLFSIYNYAECWHIALSKEEMDVYFIDTNEQKHLTK